MLSIAIKQSHYKVYQVNMLNTSHLYNIMCQIYFSRKESYVQCVMHICGKYLKTLVTKIYPKNAGKN